MGCLRNGALVVLCPFAGGVGGYLLGASLIPVPDWILNRVSDDPRVGMARDLATTAGKVWGGMQGAFWGFVIAIVLIAFLTYRNRNAVRSAGR